ncbi:MAG: hypothetical protein R6V13_08615 [Anaerolineae bacterium]
MVARRGIGNDIFAQTEQEPEDVEIPAKGYTRSISVGMQESEIEILERIEDGNGVTGNVGMRHMLPWAMRQYLAGELSLPVQEETKTTLDMP